MSTTLLAPHVFDLPTVIEESMSTASRFVPHAVCPICNHQQVVRLFNSRKKFICKSCESILTWKGITPRERPLYEEDGLTIIQVNNRFFVWSVIGRLKRKTALYFIIWSADGSHITFPNRPVR